MRKPKSRGIVTAIAVCLALCVGGAGAQSGPFPSKPIRFVVPWPSGATADIITRTLSVAMTPRLGQPVVVENKPGATGNLGAEFVANSPPDGYTLLQLASVYVMAKAMQRQPFEAKNEWSPVAQMSTALTFLAVNPKVMPNVRTLQEFVGFARSNPKHVIDYGSSGVGSSTHLAMILFDKRFGLNTNHVPYKGMGPAVVDFLAGRLSAMVVDYGTANTHVRSGALVPIVLLAPQRFPGLPDLPTARELGYADLESVVTFGIVAPRGTPAAVVARLGGVIKEAMAESGVQDGIRKTGAGVFFTDAAAYGASLDELYVKWSKVILENNIKPE